MCNYVYIILNIQVNIVNYTFINIYLCITKYKHVSNVYNMRYVHLVMIYIVIQGTYTCLCLVICLPTHNNTYHIYNVGRLIDSRCIHY